MPATYLIHKQSHASYPGGFKKVNDRMNNTPAYNHAYYEDNKEKWPNYPSQMPTSVQAKLKQARQAAANKESGASSIKRLMGAGAPSSVNSAGFKKTVDNKPYTPSAAWQARMNAAGKRYENRKAEEARKSAAEAASKQAAANSSGRKSGGSGKSKKSDAEKQAEKEAKEKERAEKKAAKEASKEKSKSSSKSKSDKEETKNQASTEEKAQKVETKKDPIDEDDSLSEREKRMFKGLNNILQNTGQSMSTYYENKGFDAIFNQYFPSDMDPDEKEVIKKKFMRYYKLEHGDASIGQYYGVIFSNSQDIEHFGVKGMKWGVRRYENYDGTLTQRGLKRYRKTEANYVYSRDKYKDTKAKYKQGKATKYDVKSARQEMREDKATMKKYRKQLHNDYMADKGKERYARGERISMRGKTLWSIVQGAATVKLMAMALGQPVLETNATYLMVGSGIAFGLVNAYAELPMGSNAQLRNYYAHKSLPDVKEKGTYNPNKQRQLVNRR